MPSYSAKFKALTNNDCEHYINPNKLPLIRFVPKAEQTDSVGNDNQSVSLRVIPNSKESDTYKFRFAVFEDGDLETLIRLLDDYRVIECGMPPTEPPAKFAFFRTMLRGDALEKWAEEVDKHTMRKKRKADGTEEVLGETNATFLAAKAAWKHRYFPGDALLVMQEYLRTQLKVPIKKGLPLRTSRPD